MEQLVRSVTGAVLLAAANLPWCEHGLPDDGFGFWCSLRPDVVMCAFCFGAAQAMAAAEDFRCSVCQGPAPDKTATFPWSSRRRIGWAFTSSCAHGAALPMPADSRHRASGTFLLEGGGLGTAISVRALACADPAITGVFREPLPARCSRAMAKVKRDIGCPHAVYGGAYLRNGSVPRLAGGECRRPIADVLLCRDHTNLNTLSWNVRGN